MAPGKTHTPWIIAAYLQCLEGGRNRHYYIYVRHDDRPDLDGNFIPDIHLRFGWGRFIPPHGGIPFCQPPLLGSREKQFNSRDNAEQSFRKRVEALVNEGYVLCWSTDQWERGGENWSTFKNRTGLDNDPTWFDVPDAGVFESTTFNKKQRFINPDAEWNW